MRPAVLPGLVDWLWLNLCSITIIIANLNPPLSISSSTTPSKPSLARHYALRFQLEFQSFKVSMNFLVSNQSLDYGSVRNLPTEKAFKGSGI